MIRIQDVDRLETELEKIKECLAGLEGATDNLQLWKENIQSRLNALESRSKLANCVDVEEFYKDDAPATPQPVRIRPEDTLTEMEQKEIREYIRYRSGHGTFDENRMPIWLVDIEEKLAELKELKASSFPAAPVKREWMTYDYSKDEPKVWYCDEHKYVSKIPMNCLENGDLWLPVLSPDEPAPDAPCEVKK